MQKWIVYLGVFVVTFIVGIVSALRKHLRQNKMNDYEKDLRANGMDALFANPIRELKVFAARLTINNKFRHQTFNFDTIMFVLTNKMLNFVDYIKHYDL